MLFALLLVSLAVVGQWFLIAALERDLLRLMAMVRGLQARPCPQCKAEP